ncbi:MAG: protein-L-isoaspartate(D-aspartate) O-methyltransferase [Candidatus Puniceispirillaceae bacterium]|jgi:protein-L-isoaspartate(D-aspartate) O-methyltransferase|nr:protein-L-isoaspartate(D-aspartate) O-methyltransferase [Pseudomonadota bacterium]
MNDFLLHKANLIMQLRSQSITDKSILSAVEKVPREKFVPESLRQHAYENASLPIAGNQTISQPYVVARMTQELALKQSDRVLEIGTGSGYQTAILSFLARRIYTVERIRPLLVSAENQLKALKISNVLFRHADGHLGWPEAAPFEKIIVTCQIKNIPETLKAQLKDGGILVAPVGEAGKEILLKVTRNGDQFKMEELMAVRFVPMVAGTAS